MTIYSNIGMSIGKYREFANDIYFKALYLLRKVF